MEAGTTGPRLVVLSVAQQQHQSSAAGSVRVRLSSQDSPAALLEHCMMTHCGCPKNGLDHYRGCSCLDHMPSPTHPPNHLPAVLAGTFAGPCLPAPGSARPSPYRGQQHLPQPQAATVGAARISATVTLAGPRPLHTRHLLPPHLPTASAA